jgi:hypothetical protein
VDNFTKPESFFKGGEKSLLDEDFFGGRVEV